MLLIKCLVPHREGPDVRVELHGNKEARHGARKGPSRPDGLWERCLPASLTSVVEVRGSPPSHLLYNRSSLLHIRLVVPEVRSILLLPLITPLHASVELIGMRSRSLYTQPLQHSSPTLVV